jgi:hypothetical protein
MEDKRLPDDCQTRASYKRTHSVPHIWTTRYENYIYTKYTPACVADPAVSLSLSLSLSLHFVQQIIHWKSHINSCMDCKRITNVRADVTRDDERNKIALNDAPCMRYIVVVVVSQKDSRLKRNQSQFFFSPDCHCCITSEN